jgi:hypothetical protein
VLPALEITLCSALACAGSGELFIFFSLWVFPFSDRTRDFQALQKLFVLFWQFFILGAGFVVLWIKRKEVNGLLWKKKIRFGIWSGEKKIK